MKRLLSYIWPQTRKINSDHNGILELTFVNGKKIIDSENANYSYGSLQRILEVGLSKIELKNVQSVLLLGLGGGSVIDSLRHKFDYDKKIVAIELDQTIIDLAKDEFSISNSENLTIINDDALDYAENCNNQYDLLIVDLFIDNEVPEQFYTKDFCNYLSCIMSVNGSMIFNLGIDQINKEKINIVSSYFQNKNGYNAFLYGKIEGTNTLLVVIKNNE